jgi:hypothetical protein
MGMTDEYDPTDINRVLADLPPVRKRGDTIYGPVERPDLWQRAIDKEYDVSPGESTFPLAIDEYFRLLLEES